MANAGICYENFADAGLISASSQVREMPPTRLQNPHIAERWRSESSLDFLFYDALQAVTFDTVMLRGLAATSIRVRASLTDSSALSGDVYDTGVIADGTSYFETNYDGFLHSVSSPRSARYFRIDLVNSVGTFIEVGRLGIFARTVFQYNYMPGEQIAYVDRSITGKSRGGQTLIWNDNKYRVENISFDFVTSVQRFGIVETIDRICGKHQDVLLMKDVNSSCLVRDSIWGLMTIQSPVVQGQLAELFSKQYQIEERL